MIALFWVVVGVIVVAILAKFFDGGRGGEVVVVEGFCEAPTPAPVVEVSAPEVVPVPKRARKSSKKTK